MRDFSGHAQAYIAGQWRDADGGAVFPVLNPASGAVIADVPNMGAAETQAAIGAASGALPAWSARSAEERSGILKRWAELMRENAEDLGRLMTREQGKPLMEAVGEILTSADYADWFAAEALNIRDETAPAPSQDATVHIHHAPVGVVGAVTPWNFPAAMVARKVAPALAAGCTVVLKPAEDTPLTALALADLAEQAGVPPGAFSVVTGDRAAAINIGRTLTDSDDVQKISFTGSTEVGKKLMEQCARSVKRVSMELGGNAPFIVLETADPAAALSGALSAKFMNAGQMCVSPNRIFVHDSLYDAFAKAIAQEAQGLKVGDGLDMNSQMGPLINDGAAVKVQRHVDDAVAKGARLLAGGGLAPEGSPFFQPTVLADMTPDMLIAKEETFGPVAALFRFKAEAEVITQANATPFGLAAYVYGEKAAALRVASQLEAGMVCVNEAMLADPAIPFGGVKQSGVGRENSHHGIREYLEIKATVVKNTP